MYINENGENNFRDIFFTRNHPDSFIQAKGFWMTNLFFRFKIAISHNKKNITETLKHCIIKSSLLSIFLIFKLAITQKLIFWAERLISCTKYIGDTRIAFF